MSSGGRLPTEVELFYVITKGMVRPQSGTEVSSPVNATEQFIDGVTDGNSEKLLTRKTADVNVALDTDDFFRPNSLGIKGLNGEIGEWVFKIANDRAVDHEKINRYAVVGGQEGAPKKGYSLPSLVNRIPWEGCEDVGFRTVRNAAQ
jgi:formylglycine-generating enzyme required for sulfatase activity